MREHIQIAINSPWKAFNELAMYLIKPFVYFYLYVHGVKIGKNAKFYGFPKVMRYRGSKITIGDNFEDRNWKYSNPLGINHATILCTWSKNATIRIGNDVGISGGSIVAKESIEIGDGTLVGANSTIIDNDFHPVKSMSRRYDKEGVKAFPVKIGDNVFIGMNSSILKGSIVSDNSVIPAGNIIHR
jgi:acetyltransferase-like isoleucine patch superfamily enzyme